MFVCMSVFVLVHIDPANFYTDWVLLHSIATYNKGRFQLVFKYFKEHIKNQLPLSKIPPSFPRGAADIKKYRWGN